MHSHLCMVKKYLTGHSGKQPFPTPLPHKSEKIWQCDAIAIDFMPPSFFYKWSRMNFLNGYE